jgi:hypothetical protein
MNDRRSRYEVDWGHLLFLTVIGGAVLWYLLDAASVSLNIHNLLLVGPLSVLALGLCLVILPQCFKRTEEYDAPRSVPDVQVSPISGARSVGSWQGGHLWPVVGLVVSLGLYVSLLNVIGFDVGTWLFVLAVMLICGERRPLPLIAYPLLVALILISAFRALLPYPMLTLVI